MKMNRDKILHIQDFDLVVAVKNGFAKIYKLGVEEEGIVDLELKLSMDNLPTLKTKRIICDKNGQYHRMGLHRPENWEDLTLEDVTEEMEKNENI